MVFSQITILVQENPRSSRAKFPLGLTGQNRVTQAPVAHERGQDSPDWLRSFMIHPLRLDTLGLEQNWGPFNKEVGGNGRWPAIKKVCHTKECGYLEQEEEKRRTQDPMDTWHSHREEGGEKISNAKEIGEESQRGEPRKAQEGFPGGHVYSGSCGRALSKRRL